MSNPLELEVAGELSASQRIPNNENRSLRTKLETIQQRFQLTQYEIDEYHTKIQTVEQHFENVQEELSTTKRLCHAWKNDIETEEHLKMLDERQIGRVKQNIERIEHQLKKTNDQNRVLNGQVLQINRSIDEIKVESEWNEQDLQAWIGESTQKDEDIMALMKYTREDEAKVKNLLLKIERLSEESVKKKRAVDNEILDTTSLRIEFDKTASHFQRSHLHRQGLIKRWEDTIEQMHQRDHHIDLLAIRLLKVKAEMHSNGKQLNEKREFYEKEQRNNYDCQLRTSMAERQVVKLRMQYDDAERNRLLYENELSSVKGVLERTEKDKQTVNALVSQLKQQLIDRQAYLDDVSRRKTELIATKHDILDAKHTAEEQANQMDQLYIAEQEREMQLNNRLKSLSEKSFKVTQQLFNHKDRETNLQAEINGSIVTVNHLQIKVNKLDNEGSKQYEILYHQDYQIQSFERRLNRLQGDKSLEEQLKLQKQISELQTELKGKQDEYTMLIKQTKRIREETKYLKTYFDQLNAEKAHEQWHIDEIDAHETNDRKLIQKLRDEKQNLLVDEHLMRLEVKRFRSILHSKADDLVNLETRRLRFHTIGKEQRNEISAHQAKLRQQVRDEGREKSEISSQLHDRLAKIEKLKKRYEISQISMAPPESFHEEETFQAYYVIKAAREKENLQQTGDELERKNRRAEQELIALQNTLQILNQENHQIKHSFKKPADQYERKKLQFLKLENDCREIEKQLFQTEKPTSLTSKPISDTSFEENDSEVRLLKEFNRKIDSIIEQTVSTDLDAKHCYDVLKSQSNLRQISTESSVSLSIQSNSTHSSMSKPSRQSNSTNTVQLSIEGTKLSNGNRQHQQKTSSSSSSVKRVIQ